MTLKSDYVTVKLTGFEEFQDKLKGLDEKTRTKAVRAAVRAGAEVSKKHIVEACPKDTGLTSEHFDIRTTTKGSDAADAVTAHVGPNWKLNIHQQTKGKKAGIVRSAWFIVNMLEFGSRKMVKRPFMTQAFASHIQEMLEAIRNSLKEFFDEQ